MSVLPHPRGPVSEALFDALRRAPHTLSGVPRPGDDEDLQLALYCCYELHYCGFEGVDDRWEWEPSLLRLRAELERRFEGALLERIGAPGSPPDPAEIDVLLRELMSLFGLHRRLRGAIVGHLALFEMTSSVPNRRYASGLRRLGYDGDACLFFDVHVVADAVHESVAALAVR